MDPVSAAIIAVINAGIGEIVKDSYNALKMALQTKFGEDSNVIEAVEKLEKNPSSAGWKESLQTELQAVKAEQDDKLKQLAEALLEKLEGTPEGKEEIKKYNIKAKKVGAVGDNIHISGGLRL